MNATFNVARDVLSELFARKFLLAMLVFIGLFLIGLTFALDLEIVEGALAAGKLFGQKVEGNIVPVDVALRPIFAALTSVVFFIGILFGIVATSDIAPKMLRPGRVELMLSLPVHRASLVIGTYLGVVAVASAAILFAIGGASLILFFKAGFFTWAPFLGALGAIVGFASVYAFMLFCACALRSAALSAGGGLFLFILCLLVDDRDWFTSWFRQAWVRNIVDVLITPLPRLRSISQLVPSSFEGAGLFESALPLLFGALFFAACFVGLASYLVSKKDY